MDKEPTLTETERIGRRYRILDHIGTGGMGSVHRALDRLTGNIVALKRVTIPSEQLQFQSHSPADDSLDVRRALAEEFRTLSSLRHPHIISVLDYGFDERRQPYFTMELLTGAGDIVAAAQGRPQQDKIDLLIQLFEALAYLHRRGIIHRDLKPDNVAVVDSQVKVLDFGLAAAQEFLGPQEEFVVGTLAYLAPELLRGHSASVQSDLYAAGMIAYELLVGAYPYNTDSVQELIHSILYQSIPLTDADLDLDLQMLLLHLLAREPSLRYGSVSDVLALLRPDARATSEVQITIRESYLQAARFVGRETELLQLMEALSKTMEGQGSAWLLGGESGVGKSRLMEELRARALVRGVQVLRGTAIAEGGALYQIWRDPLRWMTLTTPLDDLEAGVLKLLVPDMESLLERPVPDAHELEPEAMRERLLHTLETVFERQGEPMIIMLEDLHWARDESLEVLNRLSRIVKGLPVWIIGSYRDDERPELASLLPEMQVMPLQRLSDSGIAELSAAMLGPAGTQQDVVDLLRKETEGNVFFIVEIVRALAEEAGDLDAVGKVTLPLEVVAGGVRQNQIILRRLRQVPAEALPFLRAAAIAGRYLDLKLLKTLFPAEMVERSLLACSDAAVLTVQDDRWLFAHDKLRDGVLAELNPGERAELNRQVATAIEQSYPDTPDMYAALTHHWSEAGDKTRELHYTTLSAEHALRNGAYREASELIERGLALNERSTHSPQLEARLRGFLGKALYGLGQSDAAMQNLEQALALMGRPIPTRGVRLFAGIAGQGLRQMLHRRLPSRYHGRYATSARGSDYIDLARALRQVGMIYFIAQRPLASVYATVQALNLAEQAQPTMELAQLYAGVGALAGTLLRRPAAAMSYFERALATADHIDDPAARASVLFARGFYLNSIGRWDAAEASLTESIEINRSLGDDREIEQGMVNLFHNRFFRGRVDKHIMDQIEAMMESAARRDDAQALMWSRYDRALALALHGQTEDAAALIELVAAGAAAFEQVDVASLINVYGLQARLLLKQNKHSEAVGVLQRQEALIAKAGPPVLYYVLDGYAAGAEVYVTLLEAGHEQYKTQAAAALKNLGQYARFFALGKPRLWLWQGLYTLLLGKPEKAHALWNQAASRAQALGLGVDEALAQYQIGRHLAPGDPQRKERLTDAMRRFQEMGMEADSAAAQTAYETG